MLTSWLPLQKLWTAFNLFPRKKKTHHTRYDKKIKKKIKQKNGDSAIKDKNPDPK